MNHRKIVYAVKCYENNHLMDKNHHRIIIQALYGLSNFFMQR